MSTRNARDARAQTAFVSVRNQFGCTNANNCIFMWVAVAQHSLLNGCECVCINSTPN